ncbi:AlpA family phage regulatory protein [Variovorax sp. LG9.2]|uniref:AlpA family phage regulatory protein n=1 Tax=Variovorax sp. LG9.2 TaxID=3048626 RepID=UPI002B2228EF|nr:AlpA family phage regulatory protein [Variovorax sp. LG9.2]MEB0058806.1 AlpA family phage regulatory protein [Variovorax sp. LG9.2]
MFKDVQSSASRFSPEADSCVTDESLHILRLPAVIHRVGLSRSSIYNRIRAGGLPRAVNLGGRAVGFVDREIDDWLSDALGRRTGSSHVR